MTFPEELFKVVELIITTIDNILAKLLNHSQFKEILVDMDSELR